jgi:putative FmdB family regulatory protein
LGPRQIRSRPAGKYREAPWLTSQSPFGRYLRTETPSAWSGGRTTINAVPIYEFVCESCGHRFEELVGSTAGRRVADVACPACDSTEVERQISSSHAPLQRQLTPNQKRRLEDKRGTDRGGAKDRFKRQRTSERARRRGST